MDDLDQAIGEVMPAPQAPAAPTTPSDALAKPNAGPRDGLWGVHKRDLLATGPTVHEPDLAPTDLGPAPAAPAPAPAAPGGALSEEDVLRRVGQRSPPTHRDALDAAISEVMPTPEEQQARDQRDGQFLAWKAANAGVTPDQARDVLRYSEASGLAPDFVAKNLDAVRKQTDASQVDLGAVAQRNPVLRDWLGSTSVHPAAARDDLEPLDTMSGLIAGLAWPFHAVYAAGKDDLKEQQLNAEAFADLQGLAGPETQQDIAKKQGELAASGDYGAKSAPGKALVATVRAAPQVFGDMLARLGFGAAGGRLGMALGAGEGIETGPGAAVTGAAGALSGEATGQFVGSTFFNYYQTAPQLYLKLKRVRDEHGQPLDPADARIAANVGGLAVGMLMAGAGGPLANGIAKSATGESAKAALGRLGGDRIVAYLAQPGRAAALSRYVARVGLHEATGALLMGLTGAVDAATAKVAGGSTDSNGVPLESVAGAFGDAAEKALTDLSLFSLGNSYLEGRAYNRESEALRAQLVDTGNEANSATNAMRLEGILQSAASSKLHAVVPGQVETLAEQATREGGADRVLVDLEALHKLAQDTKVSPRDLAAKLVGDNGEAFDKATASKTGDLEIPTPRLVRNAGTPEVEALKDAMRLNQDESSPRELLAAKAKAQERAKALKVMPVDQMEESHRRVYEDWKARARGGGASEEVADANARLAAAFFQSQAERFTANGTPTTAEDLRNGYDARIYGKDNRVMPEPGPTTPPPPDLGLQPEMRERFATLYDPEKEAEKLRAEHRARFFTDRKTGLYNFRGYEARERDPARPYTTELQVAQGKTINDTAGHDAGDNALKVMGNVLRARGIPDAVRRENTVSFDHATPEEGEAAAKAIQEKLGAGLVVTHGTANVGEATAAKERLEPAAAVHKATKTTGREAKTIPERDAPLSNAEGLKERLAAEPTPERAKVTPAHIESYAEQLERAEPFDTIHLNPDKTLTDDGFHLAAEVAETKAKETGQPLTFASADARGIGKMNDAFGREATDEIMAHLSRAFVDLGGEAFNLAHPHGDEFYAVHVGDPKHLEELFADVAERTDKTLFWKKDGDGYIVQEGVKLAHALGKTFDEADRTNLPAAKAAQAVSGPRRITAEQFESLSRDATGEGHVLVGVGGGPVEVGGGEAGGAFGGAGAEGDAGAGAGEHRGGEGRGDLGRAVAVAPGVTLHPDFVATHPTEQVFADAEAWAAKRTKPENRAAVLAYIQGIRDHLDDSAEPGQLAKARAALPKGALSSLAALGLADPEYGFHQGKQAGTDVADARSLWLDKGMQEQARAKAEQLAKNTARTKGSLKQDDLPDDASFSVRLDQPGGSGSSMKGQLDSELSALTRTERITLAKLRQIDPPHGVRDTELVDALVKSIDAHDEWSGPPLVLAEIGGRQQLLTGSHRYAALEKLLGSDGSYDAIPVPIVRLKITDAEHEWLRKHWLLNDRGEFAFDGDEGIAKALASHPRWRSVARLFEDESKDSRIAPLESAGGRGEIVFGGRNQKGQRRFDLRLLANADKSTLAHETFHFLSEVMGDLAQRPDAPESIKADYATLLKHMGFDSHEQRQAEALERSNAATPAARVKELTAKEERGSHAWEQYLTEGKAPSVALARPFAKFASWMLKIYGGVRGVQDTYSENHGQEIGLSDDVRQVFDRLLASDSEIKRAQNADASARPLDAVRGKTPEERAAYDALTQRVAEEGRANVLKALADPKREENTKLFREERARIRGEVNTELDHDKTFAAIRYLKEGEHPTIKGDAADALKDSDTGRPYRLDRKALVKQYGPDFVRELPRGIFAAKGEPKASADDLAGVLGFEDGRALVESMRNAPDRRALVEHETQQRLGAKYGPSLLEDHQALTEAVISGLHNTAAIEKTLLERRRLAEMVAPGKVRRQALNLDPEAYRDAAKRIVGELPVGELTKGEQGAAGYYLRAERTAARRAQQAAEEGRIDEALSYNEAQLLNSHAWRLATDAREQLLRAHEMLDKATGEAWQTALGKADMASEDHASRDATNAILQSVGVLDGKPDPRALDALLKQVSADSIGFDSDALEELLVNPKDWADLTQDQAQNVRDAVKNIRHLASAQNAFEAEGKRIDRAELFKAMEEHAQRTAGKGPPAKGAAESAKALVRAADAFLTSIQSYVDTLDGGDRSGPFHQLFVDEHATARAKEVDLDKAITLQVKAAIDKMPKELRKGANEVVPGLEHILPVADRFKTRVAPPTTRSELWTLFLNSGNAGNRQRLRDGNGWSDDQVNQALQLLKPDEAHFLQGLLDAIQSLHPELAKVHEARTGLPMDSVEATPIYVNGETFRGGYFPIRYDSSISRQGAAQQTAVEAALYPGGGNPAVATGHTKSREASVKAPLSLEFGTVAVHLAAAVHDVAMGDWVRKAGSVVADDRFKAAVDPRLGEERSKLFIPWLRDIATERSGSVAGSMDATPGLIRGAMSMAKSRYAQAAVGLNLSSMLAHLTDPLAALAAGNARSWEMPERMARIAQAWPMALKSDRPEYQLSKELAFRDSKELDNFRAELAELDVAPGKLMQQAQSIRRVVDHVSNATRFRMDQFHARVLWLTGYHDGLSKGMEQDEAARRGDDFLRQTLPSGSVSEKPAVLRSREGIASVITLYGYASKMWNLWVHQPLAQAREDWARGDRALGAGDLAAKWLVMGAVGVGGAYLAGRGPQDDEDKAGWAARRLLLEPSNTVPVFGPAIESVVNSVGTGHFQAPSVRTAPGAQFAADAAEKVSRAILKAYNGEGGDHDVWQALEALGVGLGPVSQSVKTFGAAHEWQQGDWTPGGPVDAASGLLYGPPHKRR